MTGLPTDVHPVPRRAPAPPAALDLLAQAERAVIDAVYMYHKSVAALEALVGRSLR